MRSDRAAPPLCTETTQMLAELNKWLTNSTARTEATLHLQGRDYRLSMMDKKLYVNRQYQHSGCCPRLARWIDGISDFFSRWHKTGSFCQAFTTQAQRLEEALNAYNSLGTHCPKSVIAMFNGMTFTTGIADTSALASQSTPPSPTSQDKPSPSSASASKTSAPMTGAAASITIGTQARATDPFHLKCFIEAQYQVYPNVIRELTAGHKRSHWMWFIFPQLAGLGNSATSKKYAIKDLTQARAYLEHPLLGARLIECCNLVLCIKEGQIDRAFGFPDSAKLGSSMTLFAHIGGNNTVFKQVIDKHFHGQADEQSLRLIALMEAT